MTISVPDYQQLVNRRENVRFGAYFGGPIEYANEPQYANEQHLHINWERLGGLKQRYIYENLRPIKSNLWTTDRKI